MGLLADKFLNARRADVESGELSGRMWSEYFAACEQLCKAFGSTTLVSSLSPEDFGRLRAKAQRRLGPYSLGKFVQLVRTVFHFGYDNCKMEKPVKYGSLFDKPKLKTLRKAKRLGPERFVSAEDCRKLLAAAEPQMKAMILLGLNGGFGPTDLSELNRSDLKKRPGWINLVRRKTETYRRCPLWPETIAALEEVAKARPNPKVVKEEGKKPRIKNPEDTDAVFLTYKGYRWTRYDDKGTGQTGVRCDSLGQHFKKLARSCGIAVSGFYALRHTHRTVTDEVHDLPAVRLIMGHSTGGEIDQHYRERIEDDRLRAVVERVRTWLFGDDKKFEKNSEGGISSPLKSRILLSPAPVSPG